MLLAKIVLFGEPRCIKVLFFFYMMLCGLASGVEGGFHLQTLINDKLGFNQHYYTFTLILLVKIVLCIEFS
jgi:hypothetical protein